MSRPAYLLVHKDHPLRVRGVNSGAETATLWLARALAREGARVVVAGQLVEGECTDQGVEFWNLGSEFDTASIIQRARSLGTYHLISACRSQVIIESKGEEACLSRHFIAHDPSSGAVGIKPEILSRVCDSMLCVSEAQKGLFVTGGADPEKVIVVPNGADLETFSAGDPAARDYKKLIFVGALVAHKGIDILVNTFGRLKGKHPTLTLDVLGSSQMWDQEPLFDPKEVEKAFPGVRFFGSVSQKEVAEAFRRGGICVIPSRWFDSFPLTAVEAQVSGCPVVAFDVGGIREAIINGKTGALLSDVSEDRLVEALDALLNRPDVLRSMSEEALKYARTTFTWERAAKTIMQRCESATRAKRITRKKLGVVSTWNQECGLATYGKYLLTPFEKDSYVVLAEDARGPLTSPDESFVERCWKRDGADFTRLRDAIKRHNVGLVHLNCHYRFFPQPVFAQFVQELRKDGIKVIAHLHSVFTFDPYLQALVQSADGVIVHSPECKLEVIANGGSPDTTHVLPHGVYAKTYLTPEARAQKRQALNCAPNEKLIVTFGFVQPHKGMEGVIESVVHLMNKGITCRGVIAGKANTDDPKSAAYHQELKKLAQSAGVADRIHFLDKFLTDAEVGEYLSIADVVLMNYRSEHYEASGACSLAIGAGALVATSVAPPFQAFGDAVFHLTSGYPAPLALESMFKNETLAQTIRTNGARYAKENSWSEIRNKLEAIYRTFDYAPEVVKTASTVQSHAQSIRSDAKALRVLMQNRQSTFTSRGGDTTVMEKLISGLKARGVDVTVDTEGREDPSKFDIVHLFNFAIPDMVEQLGRRAKNAGVPFVVTTLLEDVPSFHNQSHYLAALLCEYVARGQDASWYAANKFDPLKIQQSDRFHNEWAVENAAALFTNGARESETIRRDYNGGGNIVEIKLGYDIGLPGDADAFYREYGMKDFVFCVGRLESRKNQMMLLKALEHSEIPIVLAAGGFTYQPDYAKAVTEFKRKGKTLLLPRISDQTLANAYAAARVHALPSWYELPGLVSLEAGYYGCNVVATNRGTSRDYMGDSAFYCEPASEESILNAIEAAYQSPFRASLKEVVMAHDWETTAQKTFDAYKQITGWSGQAVPVPGAEIPGTVATSSTSTAQPQAQTETVYDMSTGATDFQEQLEKGELAARNKDLEGASKHLIEAERLNPSSGRVMRARGAVLLAEGKFEEAAVYFQRALTIDSMDPKSLCGLGMCDMMKGNHSTAYDNFVRALRIQPNQPVAILQLIECSYILNRFDDLEIALRGYLAQNADDIEMVFCLGGCLYKQNRIQDSENIAREVLAKKPGHVGATQLMELIEKAKAESKAKAETTRMTPEVEVVHEAQTAPAPYTASPSMTATFNSIDQKLTEIEDEKRRSKYDIVRTEVEDVLRMPGLRPDQKEFAMCLKAEVMVLTGNVNGAEELYDQILEANPSSPRGLCGRGAITASRDDWAGAHGYFEEAIKIRPEYDVALSGLGLCAAHAKNYETAWSYYNRALRANFENVRALLGVIEMGYVLKKLDDVEAHIKEYLDIHPADLDFVYSLAGCFFAQGKLEEALDAISRITLFDPSHRNALELKTMIENRQGSSYVG